MMLIGCELNKNLTVSYPKIFGIIIGNGKIIPREPVAEAKIYLYGQDSLIAVSISNASGYFYFDNLQAAKYWLETKKKFELDNFAYTSLNIKFTEEKDLGTIFRSDFKFCSSHQFSPILFQRLI
jgi:hypothetical protein